VGTILSNTKFSALDKYHIVSFIGYDDDASRAFFLYIGPDINNPRAKKNKIICKEGLNKIRKKILLSEKKYLISTSTKINPPAF
jgi:hypothetical protein